MKINMILRSLRINLKLQHMDMFKKMFDCLNCLFPLISEQTSTLGSPKTCASNGLNICLH